MSAQWSDRQLDILKSMAEEGAYAQDIADAVEKGIGAVRRKLRELGLSGPQGARRKMTDKEALDAYMKIKVNRRWSMSEACDTLGVSLKTLRKELSDVQQRYGNNRKRILDAAAGTDC